MAKQTVNIGVTANDNTGDPLRTAFDKLNDNFDEVYAAGPVGTNIQVSDNTIASTNTNGNIELDPAGTGTVIIDGPMDANGVVSLNSTVTGNITPTANVTYNIGSDTAAYDEIHGNVLHIGSLILREVAGTQLEIFRSDDSTNAILSGNSTTAGSVLNNGNTVVALTQDGPITFYANNYQEGSPTVTVINSGNITTPEVVSTGAVTGTSLTDGTATISSGALTGVTTITASGNISGGNVSATGLAGTLSTAAQTNITSVGTLTSLDVTGNVAGGNLTTAGLVSATGNVAGGNLTTAGLVSATGNVAGGNLTTAGDVTTATVTASGNVDCGNVNTTAVSYGSTGVQEHAVREMYHMLTSDESAIGSTATNSFGVSPNLEAGKFYEFFAMLRFDNSSTGTPSFSFNDNGSIANFECQATVGAAGGGLTTDSFLFTDKDSSFTASTLNSAGEKVITYFGTAQAGGTAGRLDFQISVDSGTVTPKAGSSFRFIERSANSFGDVA